jgi:hypothetical protein
VLLEVTGVPTIDDAKHLLHPGVKLLLLLLKLVVRLAQVVLDSKPDGAGRPVVHRWCWTQESVWPQGDAV